MGVVHDAIEERVSDRRISDESCQVSTGTSGILTMAVGSAAFALNAALNESKRVEEHNSAAEDEEVAATILWNDHADATQWSNAWINCAEAEGFASGARLTNPEQTVAQFMPDAGSSSAAHGAEADRSA
jgi:hypothetical protein